MDNKIRTAEDVEKKLNLPSLGLVPDIKKLNIKLSVNGNGRRYEFLPYYAPNSRASDSIGNVATSIFLSAPLDTMSTLVVSSSVPGEGKTYLAVSISTAMSSGDRKVLVIDTDLRKPAIAKVFGERDGVVGLTSLLSRNDLQLSDVVRSSPVPGLYYLPAGPRPSNPAGVLRSRRMVDLVNHLKTKFNLLVFDTPPIVGFPDVPILSEYCDALILISKEGHVPVQLIRHAADSVSMGRCHLLGVVLNMADVALSHYGGYRYSDYYKYYHYDKYYSTDRLRPRSTERTSRRPHGKGGPPAESA
jgi:capsular exopolysaccharide synthesis family protein